MLIASFALHVVVAGGIVLAYFHRVAAPAMVSSEATAPPVLLLRSEAMPDAQPPVPSRLVPVRSVVTSQPIALPLPAPPMVEKALAVAIQPASLALEANPNAHVRALPPEAVLSPNPAPHLNGAKGVVFILDVSGSMYEPYAGSTRLAYARETMSERILALKDGTPFAVTLYAENACTSGPLVAANDATRAAAVRFIRRDVDCGGGTNLPAGLTSAGRLHTGSLVLVSDGDLNISEIKLMAQLREILGPVGHGPALTVIGISPRPNTGADHLLQDLADQQGGSYQYEEADEDPSLVTSASSAIKPGTGTR